MLLYYEAFKTGERDQVARVPFQWLTSLELGQREWVEIARHASWQMTRMNLNTFARHGVFAAGLSPRDSVLTNAERLARFGGGGTSVSLPLAELNRRKAKGDLVIYVSDNESWVDSRHRGATATMVEWEVFKQRNPQARLACIDIQPYGHSQVQERSDILNVGGFSDAVFEVIARFACNELDAAHWVGLIEAVDL